MAALRLLEGLLKLETSSQPSLPIVCTVGLAILTGIAGLISLVYRLSWEANLFIALMAACLAWFMRRYMVGWLRANLAKLRTFNLLTILLLLAGLMFVWTRGVGEPLNYETGLYHARAIRWMEEYRLPPGLGNLHDRIAYNPTTLVASALFSFAFLGIGSFHLVNAWLCAILLLELNTRLEKLLHNHLALAELLAQGLVFALRRLFSLELSSPGTDLPAAILIWLVILLAVDKIASQRLDRWDIQSVLIVLLSTFATTDKLNSAPIFIFSLVFLWPHRRDFRKIASAACLMGVLILPWVARNIMLSGYLIYPFLPLDVINIPWKIPPEDAQAAINWIRSWARLPGEHYSIVLAMSPGQWLPLWLNSLNSLERQVIVLSAVGPIALLLSGLWKLRNLNTRQELATAVQTWWPVYLTVAAGSLFWFYQAPAPRFGYGYLAVWICPCTLPLVIIILQAVRFSRLVVIAALLSILEYQVIGIKSTFDDINIADRVFFPLTYPVPELEKTPGNGFDIFTPTHYDQCWYAPLPCAPSLDGGLRIFSDHLEDGFYKNDLSTR